MKGARKAEPPHEFVSWLQQTNEDWQPRYSDLRGNERKAIITSLKNEQRGLCVYCGRQLDLSSPGDSFHIEHFRPQKGPNGRQDLQLDYNNLFLSCGHQDKHERRSQTCGTKKDDWFDEHQHIVPAYPACTTRFKFKLSGFVDPKVAGDVSAQKMIVKLGLDHPELVADRKETLAMLDNGELSTDDFWDEDKKLAESLAHVAFDRENRQVP